MLTTSVWNQARENIEKTLKIKMKLVQWMILLVTNLQQSFIFFVAQIALKEIDRMDMIAMKQNLVVKMI